MFSVVVLLCVAIGVLFWVCCEMSRSHESAQEFGLDRDMELLDGTAAPAVHEPSRPKRTGGERLRERNALPADFVLFVSAGAPATIRILGVAKLDRVEWWDESVEYDSFVLRQRDLQAIDLVQETLVWRVSELKLLPSPADVACESVGVKVLRNIIHFKSLGPLQEFLGQVQHRGAVPRGWRLHVAVAATLLQTRAATSLVTPASFLRPAGVPAPPRKLTGQGVAAPVAESVVVDREPLLENKFALERSEARGAIPYQFEPEVLLKAWQLTRLLKSSNTSVKKVVSLALGLVLDHETADRHQRAIADGSLKIPGRTVLLECGLRLNTLYSLFQRELLRVQDSCRYLSGDASPQGGFNYYAVIEDRRSVWRGQGCRPLLVLAAPFFARSCLRPVPTTRWDLPGPF